VKNIVIIFFLSTHLLSTTELAQLFKMPLLVHHYLEHKQYDNMDLVTYIVHHYGGHEKDADWDKDMQLPFMKHAHVLYFAVPLPTTIALPKHAVIPIPILPLVCYMDSGIPTSHLSAVWQPPKFC